MGEQVAGKNDLEEGPCVGESDLISPKHQQDRIEEEKHDNGEGNADDDVEQQGVT